jgi:hypothetical protein
MKRTKERRWRCSNGLNVEKWRGSSALWEGGAGRRKPSLASGRGDLCAATYEIGKVGPVMPKPPILYAATPTLPFSQAGAGHSYDTYRWKEEFDFEAKRVALEVGYVPGT